MSYTDVPNSVRSLEHRIRNLEGSEELAGEVVQLRMHFEDKWSQRCRRTNGVD